MEREELRTKIDAALGSTKLTLSERTINDFLDDALVGITDDADVTEDFITRKVNVLKSMDGNLHSDVSEEVQRYKDSLQKPPKDEDKHDGDDTDDDSRKGKGDDGSAAEIEDLKNRLKAIEDERQKAAEERQREADRKELHDAFKTHFDKAGVKVNDYILKQTIRDFDGEGSVEEKVKALESKYYENLKEAGFDFDGPHAGGIDTNKSSVKTRREALKEELRSRGMLPKKES